MNIKEKLKAKYGDKYDYSLVEYINRDTPIKIICPIHGVFEKKPTNILRYHGCDNCKHNDKKATEMKKFIKMVTEVHGDKYDYSMVEYVDSDTPIKIICPIHGVFEKTPRNMLRSHGCNKCYENNKTTKALSTEQFIERAREVHGDKYDYSMVEYKTIIEKVKIICPDHGVYEQQARSHLDGHHCKKCSLVAFREKRVHTTDHFIERATEVHGDKYDYSALVYSGVSKKIKIICKMHGSFMQLPMNHLRYGCNQCSNEKWSGFSTEEYIERATEVHGDKYDYSESVYTGMHSKIKIICKIHGEFETSACNHVHITRPTGCFKCSCGTSKNEKQVIDFIKGFYSKEIISNDRVIIAPYELDIVLPEEKIAIEYCGLYWHSNKFKDKKYHLKKLEACNKAGYRLITIFEDEWIHTKELTQNKLRYIFHQNSQIKVYARQCDIRVASKEDKRDLLNQHHVQGNGASNIDIGLYYQDKLVAIIAMRDMKNGIYDLNRFASSDTVVGGFSKLLTYFKRNYDWNEIYTFADRRWSEGNLYLKTGFEHVYNTSPNYFYIKKDERKSRNKYMKHKLHKLLENFNNDLTEIQNMDNAGINRIYDCGNMKFIMKK